MLDIKFPVCSFIEVACDQGAKTAFDRRLLVARKVASWSWRATSKFLMQTKTWGPVQDDEDMDLGTDGQGQSGRLGKTKRKSMGADASSAKDKDTQSGKNGQNGKGSARKNPALVGSRKATRSNSRRCKACGLWFRPEAMGSRSPYCFKDKYGVDAFARLAKNQSKSAWFREIRGDERKLSVVLRKYRELVGDSDNGEAKKKARAGCVALCVKCMISCFVQCWIAFNLMFACFFCRRPRTCSSSPSKKLWQVQECHTTPS